MTDKRKQRHAMGWVLVFFLGCDLAFLFLILFFRFGLYNTRFLAEAFEESGYYSEQETLMEERFQELLSEAELSELLEFDSFRDAFEREMRNQVYGRQDEVPELTASSMAAAIEGKLDELGLDERSLLAEGGILLLSEDLGTMFHETGQIPGVASFWESERVLERTAPLLLGALCAVFFAGSGFLFFLRKRRRKYLKLLGAALAVGSLIYLLFCTSRYGWGFKKFMAEANEGTGIKFPAWARVYVTYVLPVIMIVLFAAGYWSKFVG